MSYNYKAQKPALLTDEGQRAFLAVRDNVQRLLKLAGAVRVGEAINCERGPSDSWELLACFDRMVELGELREISPPGCASQHRVFVSGR